MTPSPSQNLPGHRIDIELCPQQVRVVFNGKTIADSRQAIVLQEQNLAPVYYFPRDDVRMEFLSATEKRSFCPFKGNAKHWALSVGDRLVKVAAWSYERPFDGAGLITGYMAFYPEAIESLSLD